MVSVSGILARLNLSKRNLNNISLSQLRTVFSDLNVKEISKLCPVNRRFNTICQDESFWKNKIYNDYGIYKKYDSTWRETARIMDRYDMINMNDVWFDGRTYMEILNDSLQNGVDIIVDLQIKYLLPYANNIRLDASILLYDFKNVDNSLHKFSN